MTTAVVKPQMFFPYVVNIQKYPWLGSQIENHVPLKKKWVIKSRGYTYQIPIYWPEFERDQAIYDEDMKSLEGCPVRIGIRHVPSEYQLWPGYENGPPTPEGCCAMGEFAGKLIKRYKGQISGFEIHNEPNVSTKEANYWRRWFGAYIWDDGSTPPDPVHAGAIYASVVSAVYPIIKEYDPAVLIYAGALQVNPHMLPFLRGMGGVLADAVSVHPYLRMTTEFSEMDDLLALMRAETDLPIAATETNVLGDDSTWHRQRQAQWLRYLIRSRERLGLESITVYSLMNPWENTGMVDGNGGKPIYEVFSSPENMI